MRASVEKSEIDGSLKEATLPELQSLNGATLQQYLAFDTFLYMQFNSLGWRGDYGGQGIVGSIISMRR